MPGCRPDKGEKALAGRADWPDIQVRAEGSLYMIHDRGQVLNRMPGCRPDKAEAEKELH